MSGRGRTRQTKYRRVLSILLCTVLLMGCGRTDMVKSERGEIPEQKENQTVPDLVIPTESEEHA